MRSHEIMNRCYRPRNEKEYQRLISAYWANKKAEIPEGLTEAQEDKWINDKYEESGLLIDAIYDSQVKSIRPNDWMKRFLASFDVCTSKRISCKQADIFKRSGEEWEQKQIGYSGGYSYESRFLYNGLVYIVKTYHDCGYLTIRPKVVFDFKQIGAA